MTHPTDTDFMQQALLQSELARTLSPPNPWVGCVIVKDGKVVGQGFTHAAGEPHAEVWALRDAGDAARQATAYVTLEPCSHHGRTPPCAEALIKAGIRRVVIGIEDPDSRVSGKGASLLRQAGIAVEIGVLANEIQASLTPYLHHRKTGLPFCILKAAVSIDGCIAAADGTSHWITGEGAREQVHHLRAESQAILIGSGTARHDQPRLTVRNHSKMPPQQPLRVVLDSQGTLEATGPLFDNTLAPTLILTSSKAKPEVVKTWKQSGVEVVELPLSPRGKGVDLESTLRVLGDRGILQLLVEGGAEVFEAFLQQNLAQELHLYIGPRILGKTGRKLFGDWTVKSLTEAPILHLYRSDTCGDSVRLIYSMNKGD